MSKILNVEEKGGETYITFEAVKFGELNGSGVAISREVGLEIMESYQDSIDKEHAMGMFSFKPIVSPVVHLNKASHIIIEQREELDAIIMKAKVLKTPNGIRLKILLDAGCLKGNYQINGAVNNGKIENVIPIAFNFIPLYSPDPDFLEDMGDIEYLRKHLFEVLEIPEEYHHLLKENKRIITE